MGCGGSAPAPDSAAARAGTGAAPAEPATPGEIRALLDTGRWGEAAAAAEAALDGGLLDGDADAATLDAISEALWRGGKAGRPDALDLAGRAVALRRATLDAADPTIADSLTNLGILRAMNGRFDESLAAFDEALALRRAAFGEDDVRVAQSLRHGANVLQNVDRYDEARRRYESAVAILERTVGPDDAEVANTLNNLAIVDQDLGDYDAARQHYERALAIWSATLPEGHPLLASVLDNLAGLLADTGEWAEARRRYERALAIRAAALDPDHPDLARNRMNLADLDARLGDVARARERYESVLASLRRSRGENDALVARAEVRLAALLTDEGQLDAARRLEQRALATRTAVFGPDHLEVADSLVRLAGLDRRGGDLVAAAGRLSRAREIRASVLGDDHPSVADVELEVAAVKLAGDRPDEAVEACRHAVAIRRSALGADHPATGAALARLAAARLAAGDPGGALDDALEAERVGRAQLRLTARGFVERQAVAYAGTRERGLDVALAVAARSGTGAAAARAWDALVRSRAVVLDELAARTRAVATAVDPAVRRAADASSAAARRLAMLWVRGPGEGPLEGYRRRLDDARRERDGAELALAEATGAAARAEPGLDDVLRALPPDAALVAYARIDSGGGPSYVGLGATAGERTSVRAVDLGPAQKIDDAVAAWQSAAATGALGAAAPDAAEANYRAAGTELRRRMWDPLAAVASGRRLALIVPDGTLQLVNPATLPDDDGGYLVEAAPLLQLLGAERDVTDAAGAGTGRGLLALGAPAFDGAASAAERSEVAVFRGAAAECDELRELHFGALPGSGAEVRSIAELWRGGGSPAELLLGADAGEAAFKRDAPGRRVLHLSTHGFFLGDDCDGDDNPLLRSGLALAGANARDGEEDGILTAEEIAALDLTGVEWAVLSACDTGVGELRAGEGVFGLRRAFRVAGARTLVISLWPVDDRSTRRWMELLYRARIADGLGTAEAVATASRRRIAERREHGLETHPFHWGAFVATGDWR